MTLPNINDEECPLAFWNGRVFFNYVCGAGTLTLNSTPPSWITFDAGNHRFVGAANTYQGTTAADADAKAQAALDAWAKGELANGGITCVRALPASFKIESYTDGLIANPIVNASSNPLWDGKFTFFFGSIYMASAASNQLKMAGQKICNAYLKWNATHWQVDVYNGGTILWTGIGPTTENDPLGVYTNDGNGVDAVNPATVNIIANTDAMQVGTDNNCLPV